MKIYVTIILLVFSCHSLADDTVAFGALTLQEKFNSYTKMHDTCMQEADNNYLSNEVIDELKMLSPQAGIGLGFYRYKAIEECARVEYMALLTTLLSLELLNRKNPHQAVEDQINTYKTLLFSVNSIEMEKSFSDLPDTIIKKLQGISAITEPFNAFDAYDRAWPR
ncbi:hypothetical protein [Shewanella japonica]|uniref:DUF3015 domain-containing protein n=1 Tax=Shewanella japonica TaxID=93973 RepID=A0ABM6JQ74_9GAMM|nr:hypothetical protein [Shewanella japonica]ARD24002.1 hypothetical protein SJ2017_3763 [Shewanella japonica]